MYFGTRRRRGIKVVDFDAPRLVEALDQEGLDFRFGERTIARLYRGEPSRASGAQPAHELSQGSFHGFLHRANETLWTNIITYGPTRKGHALDAE